MGPWERKMAPIGCLSKYYLNKAMLQRHGFHHCSEGLEPLTGVWVSLKHLTHVSGWKAVKGMELGEYGVGGSEQKLPKTTLAWWAHDCSFPSHFSVTCSFLIQVSRGDLLPHRAFLQTIPFWGYLINEDFLSLNWRLPKGIHLVFPESYVVLDIPDPR